MSLPRDKDVDQRLAGDVAAGDDVRDPPRESQVGPRTCRYTIYATGAPSVACCKDVETACRPMSRPLVLCRQAIFPPIEVPVAPGASPYVIPVADGAIAASAQRRSYHHYSGDVAAGDERQRPRRGSPSCWTIRPCRYTIYATGGRRCPVTKTSRRPEPHGAGRWSCAGRSLPADSGPVAPGASPFVIPIVDGAVGAAHKDGRSHHYSGDVAAGDEVGDPPRDNDDPQVVPPSAECFQ